MKLLAITLSAGMAALMLSGSAVLAQEPKLPTSERLFNRLDRDNDGKISLKEVQRRSARPFMRLDADRDGTVTTAEIEAYLTKLMESRRDRLLAKLDRNGDGSIAGSEIDEFIAAEFAAADTDKDGSVTLAELKSHAAAKRKQAFQDLRAAHQQNGSEDDDADATE